MTPKSGFSDPLPPGDRSVRESPKIWVGRVDPPSSPSWWVGGGSPPHQAFVFTALDGGTSWVCRWVGGPLPVLKSSLPTARLRTGLKALQGLIWADGYRSGELQGHVYPDAFSALCWWKENGVKVCPTRRAVPHSWPLFSFCPAPCPRHSASFSPPWGERPFFVDITRCFPFRCCRVDKVCC